MDPSDLSLVNEERYQIQLNSKCELTREEFSKLYQGEIDCHPSEPRHFRMRAEFRIWHDENGAHYAMYEKSKPKTPIVIEEFPIASTSIYAVMPTLLQEVNSRPRLSRKLFQVEFLSTLSGDLLITMIYHKPLDDEWLAEAEALQSKLETPIIGRSRKQKVVLDRDYVTELMPTNSGNFSYKQIETGFTQPNAKVCVQMLNWACGVAENIGGDLLELYCGNGNFTIPLSLHFDKVLATEVSKLSTRAALDNIANNKRSNIELIRLSAEEASEALNGVREFRRLKSVDLSSYHFSTIFVDPPRAGIDQKTLEFMMRFDNIIYISCNPATLKENLEFLTSRFKVKKMALFDQFPYTEHRECGVFLTRIKS